MAKKQPDLSNIFAKTESAQADNSDLDEGHIRPTGVGLREGEITALDAIGAEVGAYLDSQPAARNALIRLATRRLILAYRAGELSAADIAAIFTTPEKPKPKLNL